MIKHLLTFARRHAPTRQLVNINSILENVLALRAYEQKVSNIQAIVHFDPDLTEIVADYFQLLLKTAIWNHKLFENKNLN